MLSMRILTLSKYGKENEHYLSMFSPLKFSLKYVDYWLSASNGRGHGIHSPFVFEFIQKILNDKTIYPEYQAVEQLRKKLLADHAPVRSEDYGAGSGNRSRSVKISDIIKRSAKSPKYGRLLFRMVRFYKSQFIIELGTSAGISTSYLALAQRSSIVITGEGNHAVASVAESNFNSLGLSNVRIIRGNFDNTLPQLMSSIPHTDLVFVDGNHRRIPTLNYFRTLLTTMAPSSVMIFDDIHWSAEMESAWNEIKEHPLVMLTIDLFLWASFSSGRISK